MFYNLLFVVASVTGSPTEVYTPPPAPVIVEIGTAKVIIQTENGVIEREDETVTFHTGDGIATSDRATFDRLTQKPSNVVINNETEEEYLARLNRQLCAAKSVFC